MTDNITDSFIDSLFLFLNKDIPEYIIEQAKMCLLDYYSCIKQGYVMVHDDIEEYLSGACLPIGNSSVYGTGKKTSMQTAALLNGIMAHVAELDDGHRYGMLHPGAPIISAVLAVSEQVGLSDDQILKGIVSGYEAAIRIASAIQTGHKLKGYHATGTCGTIGAAIGIAFALGYSKSQMKTTLSAAASDAAGILALMDNTSTMKAYNIGRAAAAGINSAFMGSTSFSGPIDVLGSERGYFSVMTDKVNEDYLTDGILGRYAIETIYRKMYAACRHCHPAIEAVLMMQKKYLIVPEQIERIIINTYDTAIKGHDHVDIQGTTSAKMSMPYSVAASLLFNAAGHIQFSKDCMERVIRSGIMDKIQIKEEPEMSALVPHKRCAEVIIYTGNKSYSERVDYPKGEPENPVTIEELKEKFYSAQSDSDNAMAKIRMVCNTEELLK